MTSPTATDPSLPPHLEFPPHGSVEYERFLSKAREGAIVFGPNDSGCETIWDLTMEAHALIAGPIGSGTTVVATLPIVAALCCPDDVDLVVVDPKRELTWTADFPNTKYVTDVHAIADTIEQLSDEKYRRTDRINRRNAPNLKHLRELHARRPEWAEDGPVPKRLLVVFDAAAYPSLPEWAKSELRGIILESRAIEINLVLTAQLSSTAPESRELWSSIAFRMCFGTVDPATSIAITGGDHASQTRLPYGRIWASSGYGGLQVTQIPYLPVESRTSPWDDSVHLEGAVDRARRSQRTR